MIIAIIDADLIGRKKHRFPNLACMKLAGYHKDLGDIVELKLDYSNLQSYDKVYISRVFTDTPVDEVALQLPNVTYGGTGFYYDKAPQLPYEVEHHMPDYHLYDDWVSGQLALGVKASDLKYYTDYSIGFMTRGCFRKCPFCVNKNYNQVMQHSPLDEFLDPTRKKICLLDDNFLGCSGWKTMLDQLKASGKRFQFKQGLDERILTDEKCRELFSCKYDGDYIFAFDNVADAPLITSKLELIRKYTDKVAKFYVLCGFDRGDKYDDNFWIQDIIDLFTRIKILMQFKCIPYVMRFERYKDSPYRGIYISAARWSNQPSMFKKKSFREFCMLRKDSIRYLEEFESVHPEVATQFFDLHFND